MIMLNMPQPHLTADEARSLILTDSYLTFQYRFMYETMLEASRLDISRVEDFTIVEIGSAGGFLKELHNSVITTDVRDCFGVDIICSADTLPFRDNSIDCILAKDTFHHLGQVKAFLDELNRVLKPGITAILLEPNWNPISRFIYKFLHPEDWLPKQQAWDFISRDPMESNQALAYIVFKRDIQAFQKDFPKLTLEVMNPINGMSYLISGGVANRTKVPSKVLILISKIENRFRLARNVFGINRLIRLTKV